MPIDRVLSLSRSTLLGEMVKSDLCAYRPLSFGMDIWTCISFVSGSKGHANLLCMEFLTDTHIDLFLT